MVINPMKKGKVSNYLTEISKNNIIPPTLRSAVYAIDLLYGINTIKGHNIVISHRYDICCKVYSQLAGANMSYINTICEVLPEPDLYIHIKVPPKIAEERINFRQTIKSRKENIELLEKADLLYNAYISKINEEKVRVIDNTSKIDGNIHDNNTFYESIEAICNEHIFKKSN